MVAHRTFTTSLWSVHAVGDTGVILTCFQGDDRIFSVGSEQKGWPKTTLGQKPVSIVNYIRRAINIEKVKFLLTLYGPLPPTFYLVKPKILGLPPLPPKSAKIALWAEL